MKACFIHLGGGDGRPGGQSRVPGVQPGPNRGNSPGRTDEEGGTCWQGKDWARVSSWISFLLGSYFLEIKKRRGHFTYLLFKDCGREFKTHLLIGTPKTRGRSTI